MRRQHILALTLVAALLTSLFSTLAFAADGQPDINGDWTFIVTNPQGPTMSLPVALKQDGTKVTGTMKTPEGEVAVEGALKASDILLQWNFENLEPGLTVQVTLTGTVNGDSMKGVADYGSFGGGEWEAKRTKQKP